MMPRPHSPAPICDSVTSMSSGSLAAAFGATVRSAATVTAPRSARRSTTARPSSVVRDLCSVAVNERTAGVAAGLDTAEIETDSTSGLSAINSGDAERIF